MRVLVRVTFVAIGLLASSSAAAQTATPPPVRVPGTTITVTAQKEPADPATLPVSVTVLTEDLLKAAGVTFISDAGVFSPNTHFTEFTARKLSNPRIRGIGASPANPGVTTYVDGVPQLNANSTSFDLVDVGQIEFVRGPSSALFGRNALGGVINILSTRPSLSGWTGLISAPFGGDGQFAVRANASGPIRQDTLAVSAAVAYSRRDGFTRNLLTGADVDFRNATSAKGQVLWTPSSAWEARVIVSGERARDGDYALNDLDAVRTTPFAVSRDFQGHTDRDLMTTAVLLNHRGPHVTFSSTTGFVRWKTADATDLDYTGLPLATRDNTEEATQFSQEVRVATTAGSVAPRNNRYIALRFQAGALVFTQAYNQRAFNTIAPFVLSPGIGFPVVQTSPLASLDDLGLGVYGQGTLDVMNRVDVSFGARFDRERRDANIVTGYAPMIAPDTLVDMRRRFSDVSPQVAVAVKLRPGSILYGNVSRAFKAGGFNPVSPPGSEGYGEEYAWNIEGGIKTRTSDNRFSASAAVFSIDWRDLQLNLPIPGAPGQFFIDNIGGATSRGVECEVTARPWDGLDLFGAVGTTRARFDAGTLSGGVDVSGRKVPNAPAFTATVGVQYSREFRAGRRLYGRADVVTTGAFEYDEANTQRQGSYTLTNLRAGLSGRRLFVEAWIRNAFDTRYVPLAFAYPGFTASGFIGEPGRPRTWGIDVGVGF